jgi:hypothetical protein
MYFIIFCCFFDCEHGCDDCDVQELDSSLHSHCMLRLDKTGRYYPLLSRCNTPHTITGVLG